MLGPLERTGNIDARLDGHPEIFVVGNTGARPVTFAPHFGSEDLEWHTDHIHRDVPARASMLYAKEIPSEGGDTLFACMYSAYDALSPEDQAAYEKLTAVHSVAGLRAYLQQQAGDKPYDAGRQAPMPDAVTWPLVRRHPVTGRKALYFGAKVTVGIEGMPQQEGLAFIANLSAHATRPDRGLPPCLAGRRRRAVGTTATSCTPPRPSTSTATAGSCTAPRSARPNRSRNPLALTFSLTFSRAVSPPERSSKPFSLAFPRKGGRDSLFDSKR